MILDCDPGHDDAIAILLALGSPQIDLLGITTIGGNHSLEKVTFNARAVCELAGRPEVPVHAGRMKSLIREAIDAAYIHGETGLDGVELPEPSRPLAEQHAVAYVIDPALVPTRRCPDGVELCGALACGMTIADMRATADDSCTMRVGTDPRTNCFPDLVASILAPGRPRPIRCPPPFAPDPHPASLDLRQGDLAPLPFVQPHTSRRTRRTVPCSWPSISWEFSPSSP